VVLTLRGFYGKEVQIPEDLYYYPRKQIWIKPSQRDQELILGVTHAMVVLVSGFIFLDYIVSEGQEVEAEDIIAYVETYKAIQNIETPIAGVITELNGAIIEEKAPLIDDCHYTEGWICKIKPRGNINLEPLFLDAQAYQVALQTPEHCGRIGGQVSG
jgi:glycine cleavage system H lipoate-binding protein